MTQPTFNLLIVGWIAVALVLVPVQLFITAPYGRYRRAGWGPEIGNRTGWIVMELVSPLALLAPFFFLGWPGGVPTLVFVALWLAHYINRALIYPLTTKTAGKTIPLAIVLGAVCFNSVNGWSNGYYLAQGWGGYGPEWLTDPRFLIGVALFFAGAIINLWADRKLVGLRKNGEPGYSIPRGGLFRFISCPNHFGEIVEWTGFAIACWNLPAAAFAIWTAANLGPRALSHHRWYRAEFADYPADRKALVPFVL